MNLFDENEASADVLFVNFNQNRSSLAVATNKGFKLYNLNQVNELEVIHENAAKDIRIVERMFSSNLVAIVTISAPRKLKVCHFKKGNELCNYSYSNTILTVKLNRARLVVCLEESLYIHNIKDMKVLHIIRDTPPNPRGLCALSISQQNMFFAYPGSSTIGEVQIFDIFNLQAKLMIPAHDNPLAALAFDKTGAKLATASGRGTVIRVFNVLDGTKLHEFRRGLTRCVNIYSLSFNDDSTFLSASSNTETVHIFKLEDSKDVKPTEEPQTWMSYFGKAFFQSATYLPTQVADMLNHGRCFASVHLPFSGLKNVCSLVTIEKLPRVVVVASNGLVYIYNFDPVEGGNCTLVKTHRIYVADKDNDSSAGSEIATEPVTIPDSSSEPNDSRGLGQAATPTRTADLDSIRSSPGTAAQNELKMYDEEFPPMGPTA